MVVVDLPVFGPDSIIGRSIVVHEPSGDRWVCGTIRAGGNVPHIHATGPPPSGAAVAGDCPTTPSAEEHSHMGMVGGALVLGLVIGFVLSKMMGGKTAAGAGGGMDSMYAAGGDKSDITL